MAGTCAPARGQPTVTSTLRGSVGSAPAGSPKRYPTTTPTSCRCASPPHHAVCHRLASGAARPSNSRKPGPFRGAAGAVGAAGDKVSLAIAMTGLATELLYTGRTREGSRLASEQMALLESIGDPTPTMGLAFIAFCTWFVPVNSPRSCGGRSPSSTWPPATPPRAPASVRDHRWRSPWHIAALLGGGWAAPAGAKTSTTPSRWPDTATTRQPLPLSSPGHTVTRFTSGCLGPMTPRCARARRRCRPRKGPATTSR